MINHSNVGAQLLDGGHDVAGQNDRSAPVSEIDEDLADIRCRNRIDRLKGLIKDQDRGSMDEGCSKGDLLRHTRRVVGDELLTCIHEVQSRQQLLRALASRFAR